LVADSHTFRLLSAPFCRSPGRWWSATGGRTQCDFPNGGHHAAIEGLAISEACRCCGSIYQTQRWLCAYGDARIECKSSPRLIEEHLLDEEGVDFPDGDYVDVEDDEGDN